VARRRYKYSFYCHCSAPYLTDWFVDALLAPSDEEILGYSSESEEDEVEANVVYRKSNNDASNEEEEEDEDAGGWGTSKKDYYNTDAIETAADALAEEMELRRLQRKRLQKYSKADFVLDDWLDGGGNVGIGISNIEKDANANVVTKVSDIENEEEGNVITEVLDIDIEHMGPEERYRLLQTRYPEFDYLANEFLELHPVLQDLQQQVESEKLPRTSPTVIKCRTLAAYMATLGMYFALLTSPARDKGEARAMDPDELHDHPVMDSLVQCRELWSKVKKLKTRAPVQVGAGEEILREAEAAQTEGVQEEGDNKITKKSKKERARLAAAEEAAAVRAQQMEEAEEELADLPKLVTKSRKVSKRKSAVAVVDDESDFGEEDSMDAKYAAEKATKKKSLRFYTSQIAQKGNKRAGAGRDAGGDIDIPHRERLRDRQARLNAEAESRGKKLDGYGRGGGTALGGDSDSEDGDVAENIREEGDEYYDMVTKFSKRKKEDKKAKMEAIQKAKAEGGLVRVVEGEVDEDGKRAIGYVIEKNKGLAPKRKKDVRNPRVKKRKKFEEKKKKLASTRAVYKGGEERGGYGGEKTGIKSGLVKSIKL
jgi:U3 small nucleolar RNA-associated protein 3